MVDTSRRDELVRLRETGFTYAEIGGRFGISKQRVHILVQRYSTKTTNPHLFTTAQLAALTNLSRTTIYNWWQRGIIVPATRKPQLWDATALAILRQRRECHICRALLPKGRTAYCSPQCANKGWYEHCKKINWRKLRLKDGKAPSLSCAYEYPSKAKIYAIAEKVLA